MKRDEDWPAAISPAMFHVMVALADEDRHGYAIMKEVAADADCQVVRFGTAGREDNLGTICCSSRSKRSSLPTATGAPHPATSCEAAFFEETM